MNVIHIRDKDTDAWGGEEGCGSSLPRMWPTPRSLHTPERCPFHLPYWMSTRYSRLSKSISSGSIYKVLWFVFQRCLSPSIAVSATLEWRIPLPVRLSRLKHDYFEETECGSRGYQGKDGYILPTSKGRCGIDHRALSWRKSCAFIPTWLGHRPLLSLAIAPECFLRKRES